VASLITNPATLAMLQSEWMGVVRMRERMQSLVTATFAFGAITAPALSSVLYNLPLLLAFDLLKGALSAARDEGKFECKRSQLGDLMDAAKGVVAWIDWASLREGVRRRNKVAHDGELFDSTQCLQDIQRIEEQLVAWGIYHHAT
jgi:hypothetical protein